MQSDPGMDKWVVELRWCANRKRISARLSLLELNRLCRATCTRASSARAATAALEGGAEGGASAGEAQEQTEQALQRMRRAMERQQVVHTGQLAAAKRECDGLLRRIAELQLCIDKGAATARVLREELEEGRRELARWRLLAEARAYPTLDRRFVDGTIRGVGPDGKPSASHHSGYKYSAPGNEMSVGHGLFVGPQNV